MSVTAPAVLVALKAMSILMVVPTGPPIQQAPPWINTEPVIVGTGVRVGVSVRVGVGDFVGVRVDGGAFFVAVRVDVRSASRDEFWSVFAPAAKTCETSPTRSNRTTSDVTNNLDLMLFSFQIKRTYCVIVHNTDLNYTENSARCIALF
jgi:hypothetical protein